MDVLSLIEMNYGFFVMVRLSVLLFIVWICNVVILVNILMFWIDFMVLCIEMDGLSV